MANAHDLLMAQRAAMMGKLPYLRRVAYLESDGRQRIITGFHYPLFPEANGYKISAKILLHKVATGETEFWGTANDYSRGFAVGTNGSMFYHWRGTGTGWNFAKAIIGVTFALQEDVVFGNYRKCVVDGTEYRTTVTSKPSGGTALFTIFSLYTGNPMYGRIYDWQYFDEMSNTINLIPVLDLSGRPAMYDEVSGQFFYNQGTGEFTWGELES